MFGSSSAARRWSSRAGLLLLGLAAACSETPNTPDAEEDGAGSAPLLTESRKMAPPLRAAQGIAPGMQACGSAASYTFKAGSHLPGTVTISNDAQNIYVAYAIKDATQADKDAGWYISDTRLSITRSLAAIPKDGNGQPNPWAFPHSGEHEPVVKSFTYIIPLSTYSLKPGEKVFIGAMAGVVHPTTPADWDGEWEWLVGWGVAKDSGSTLNDLPAYTIQGCGVTPPPPSTGKGRITITFDDGWMDTYTNAYPILQKYGLKANVAINPLSVDQQWTTYMHINEVRALHNAGWTIVSHTLDHPDLKTLSSTELHRQLRDSQAWVKNQGFRGSHILVVPFHSWGDRELQAIKQYYKGARGYSVNQFSPALMQPYPVPAEKRYEITGFEPEYAPFTTAAGRAMTKDYIEQAVEEGRTLDVFFHHITKNQVAAFEELVKIIAQYKDYVVTYEQIIPA